MKTGLIRIACTMLLLLIGAYIGHRYSDVINEFNYNRSRKTLLAKYQNQQAPDVAMKTIDGSDWRLRDQLGKVVVITFWATWCGPCVDNMPIIRRIYNDYKLNDDFMLVGVTQDTNRTAVEEAILAEEMEWTQLFDNDKDGENALTRAWEITGIPTVWIIDKHGRIAGVDLYTYPGHEIRECVDTLLAKPE